MSKAFVSVIIPVRNAQRTIGKTFEYLMAIDYPRECLEIIFADGGSSDDTVKIIKDYQKNFVFIKLVEIPSCPSPGFARTKALKEARGDFVFFTDGDCAPVEGWIYKMLEVFNKDEKIGAVGGEIYTLRVDPHNLVEIFCEAFGFNRVSWRYGNLKEGYVPDLTDEAPTEICGHRAYFFVTANVAYRKEAINEAGRIFWQLPTGEDIDFGLRVRRKGWKFYFLPSASVRHMHRADLKALLKVWKSYGQAHVPLIHTHAAKFMEIIFQCIGKYPHNPRIKFRSSIRGFIYLGNFHLMHILGFFFLMGFTSQLILPFSLLCRILTLICFIVSVVSGFKFFQPCFRIEPHRRHFTFCKMKYLTNLYFLLGGLKGAKSHKVFCIEPSF